MKKCNINVLVFVICFILGFGIVASAKEVANKNKKEFHNKKSIENSAIDPFDINAEKLPPKYKGNDIVKLYSNFVKRAPLEKNEFETTEEYEKKIASVTLDAIYAMKFDMDTSRRSEIYPYDADTNKFKIQLTTETLSFSSFEDRRGSFVVKEMNKRSESYVASNAFGASRLVKGYVATQYGVALVNEDDFGSDDHGTRTVNVEIDVSIDKAKQLKDNIGILLLCKPSLYKSNAERKYKGNDLIFEKSDYFGGTMNVPISHYYDQKYINVEVLAIWIYDFRTGMIFLKKQLKELKPNEVEMKEARN
ncbi:MAG: hypothetical protein IT362_03805 [Deltaproteobacteria bacterium]|nr:hypothetical protein [Deltaproteobacteria bacterium]